MINWTDGSGTARFWGVRLLLDHFQSPGTQVLETTGQASGVAAQAYEYGSSGQGVVLLVNTRMASVSVKLPDSPVGAIAEIIDSVSAAGPARHVPLVDGTLQLLPYAFAVVPIRKS
jgi:hypothetical protein